MASVTLIVNKSLEENAALHFEQAKKSKVKMEGAKSALARSLEKLHQIERQEQKKADSIVKKTILGPKKWYHKFRWFITSDGYLAIGGRDATTNDIIVKKHIEPGDLVFHTEMSGSPFFILKAKGEGESRNKEGSDFPDISKKEVASATATFSKAWTRNLGAVEVYSITPDQVKKDIGLPKGSFMIHGKREYYTAPLDLAIGLTPDGEVMAGPKKAISHHCPKYYTVVSGERKVSDVAKIFAKQLGGDLDSIIRAFPGGEFKITPNWDLKSGGSK